MTLHARNAAVKKSVDSVMQPSGASENVKSHMAKRANYCEQTLEEQ